MISILIHMSSKDLLSPGHFHIGHLSQIQRPSSPPPPPPSLTIYHNVTLSPCHPHKRRYFHQYLSSGRWQQLGLTERHSLMRGAGDIITRRVHKRCRTSGHLSMYIPICGGSRNAIEMRLDLWLICLPPLAPPPSFFFHFVRLASIMRKLLR